MSSNFEPSHQKINKNIDNREKFKYSQIFAAAQFALHNMFWIVDFLNFMYSLAVVKAKSVGEKNQEIRILASTNQLNYPNSKC